MDIWNFKVELMRLESKDGWRYFESSIYDMASWHAVHTMSSCSVRFATLVKFAKKVPPFFFHRSESAQLDYYPTGSRVFPLDSTPCANGYTHA